MNRFTSTVFYPYLDRRQLKRRNASGDKCDKSKRTFCACNNFSNRKIAMKLCLHSLHLALKVIPKFKEKNNRFFAFFIFYCVFGKRFDGKGNDIYTLNFFYMSQSLSGRCKM